MKEFMKKFTSSRKDKLSNYKMIMDIVVYLNEISNSGAINNIEISGNYVSEIIKNQRNNKENKYINFIVTKEDIAMIGYTGAEDEKLVIPATFIDEDGLNYKVVAIGSRAFSYCTNLKSITIPESVTYIGDYAFSGCDNLTTINIDNNVDGIDDAIDCKPWGATNATINWLRTFTDFTVTAENRAMIGYTDTTEELVIPSIFTGEDDIQYKVVGISENAFRNCRSLSSIILPDTIVSISTYAFAKCTSLKSVIIPKGVKRIKKYAFGGCESLSSVILPNTIISIGKGAFLNAALSRIDIPEKVISIESDAFSYCVNLTTINVDNVVDSIPGAPWGANNATVNWLKESIDFIITPENRHMVGYTDESKVLDIPATFTGEDRQLYKVVGIGDSAFWNCIRIKSLTLPNTIVNISTYAFTKCTSLTSVTIPDTVTSIGKYAFSSCISLTTITIPNSVTSIEDSAFYGCKSLKSIVIPKGVTSIGDGTFWGCESLNSVSIPEGVTSIGSSAFRDTALSSVTIPDSVTDIGEYTFSYCALSSITIPNSVTDIGMSTFWSCNKLTTINVDNTVDAIPGAPWGADNVTVNWLKESIDFIVTHINRTKIGFSKTTEELVIPSIFIDEDGRNYKVVAIDDWAFLDCSLLKSITIPDSVKSIGHSAFSYCKSLTSITIPESIKSIDSNTFLGCESLSTITIPKSVININEYAFFKCDKLTTINVDNEDDAISDAPWGATNATINWLKYIGGKS